MQFRWLLRSKSSSGHREWAFPFLLSSNVQLISVGFADVHICDICLSHGRLRIPGVQFDLSLTEVLSCPRSGVVGFLWVLECRFQVLWEHFRKVKMEWPVQRAAWTMSLSNSSSDCVYPSSLGGLSTQFLTQTFRSGGKEACYALL